MDLNKKQRQVLDIIEDYPEAANDEPLLLSKFWKREGWSDSKSLEYNLRHVTRPETISRRRRELYNMGLITYSPKAEQDRTEAFSNEKQAHGRSWLDRFKTKENK
jgi:hypothetical protein